MAKNILEELVTVLGFEIDDDDLKKYDKQIESVKNGMKQFTLVATASAAAVSVFLDSVANATAETSRFSKTMGVSFEEMQRLTHATQLWGGSIEDVKSTLSTLTRLASTAARGAGGGEIFGFLGISPTQDGRIKDSIQLLKEIADATNKIPSAARRADLLSQVGVSERMVLLLRQGSKGIETLGKELDQFGFVLTEEQAENAEAYFMAVVKAKAAVKSLGNEIGLRLVPRLTETLDQFLEWIQVNKDFTTDNIDKWIVAFEKLLGPLSIAAGLFGAIALAANLKNTAIGALVLAIGAIVDDLLKFQKGEKGTLTEEVVEGRAAIDILTSTGLGEFLAGVREFVAAPFQGGEGGVIDRMFPQGVTSNSSNMTNNIEIRIDGATSPNATGTAVVDRLQEFFRGEFSGVTVATRT